jgi:hypothetical protein
VVYSVLEADDAHDAMRNKLSTATKSQ